MNLSNQEKKILKYAHSYGSISIDEVRTIIHPDYRSRQVMKRLEMMDLVERINYGVWKIKDDLSIETLEMDS